MDIKHSLQICKVLTKENKLLRESINLGLCPGIGWDNFFLVPGSALDSVGECKVEFFVFPW